MLWPILGIIVLIVIVFAIIVAMQPSAFTVARSATMAAPASVVFEQLNVLKNWPTWIPWIDLDPNMEIVFSGPASGEGASYSWRGNSKAGEGTLIILAARPSEQLDIELQFIKPFRATNTASFVLKPDGGGTHVTWTMNGQKNFMFKAVGLFMSCDKMIGPDFEKGLSRLKKNAETNAKS